VDSTGRGVNEIRGNEDQVPGPILETFDILLCVFRLIADAISHEIPLAAMGMDCLGECFSILAIYNNRLRAVRYLTLAARDCADRVAMLQGNPGERTTDKTAAADDEKVHDT
jgi:hypothetical protein